MRCFLLLKCVKLSIVEKFDFIVQHYKILKTTFMTSIKSTSKKTQEVKSEI